MKLSHFLVSLMLVVCSQAALGEDKDPVCGIFKRVVKSQSVLYHTGYVFMADGTGYIYYWDSRDKATVSGPDFTWERVGRGRYRWTRTWEEFLWAGKTVTRSLTREVSLSDDSNKMLSQGEPTFPQVPAFYRVN